MRVIPPMLAGLMALAAPSVQAAPNPNENWRPLNPHCPLAWETKPAARVGIRRCGATGGASGGGVRARPIDDLASLGGRLNGLGV
jgi:hypothetical protein